MQQKNYLALGLLGCVLLLSGTTADISVYVTSKYIHQPLTSTTLKWLPVAHYDPNGSKEIVIGGFENVPDGEDTYANQADKSEAKKRPLYVCRAMHSGVWVAGTQKDKDTTCTVTLHGMVRPFEKYELLENVDAAARISWLQWDKYTQLHLGTVYVEKNELIARYVVPKTDKEPRYSHYIGTLTMTENYPNNIVYVTEDGREESAKEGELLVETEPIRYELSGVKLNWSKKRDIKRVPRVLNQATIMNHRQEKANMAEACSYSYKYSVYWGRRYAILNGLSTTIKLANGTSLPNITWGMHVEQNRTDVYTVSVTLEPGTGVNVTLKANYTEMEVPYTATLISHYEDGMAMSRVITGIRQEESLFDVIPEFGPIYFLSNFSLVPTTVAPPTTTELPTTTTTTTTTMISTTQETSRTTYRHRQTDMDHDENSIKKTDLSSMQSDDGGPVPLKNKVDMAYGKAATFKSTLVTLVAPSLLLLILHRIT
ncbi:protein unzipped isoform X2 [Pseudomyrmex gracilis]|nr:protein unzipped isoform X2 [Pseudomyrmex gracilis]XP_020282725.1 protein unzipped isoform X2 [Pseudomyrmex gracilis]